MKTARFFTIFVTALFLAAPIVAADFADENFSVKIDIDTRHPTLAEDLDFTITLMNVGEKDERDVKIRLAIFDLGISNAIQLTSNFLDARDITQYLTLDIP